MRSCLLSFFLFVGLVFSACTEDYLTQTSSDQTAVMSDYDADDYIFSDDATVVAKGKPGGGKPPPPPNPVIVFAEGNDLKVMNSDGSNVRVVYTHESSVHFPVWDFSGTRLAFISSYDLWIVKLEDEKWNAELLMSGAGTWPTFLPAGKSIVVNGRNSDHLLYVPISEGEDSSLPPDSGYPTRSIIPTAD